MALRRRRKSVAGALAITIKDEEIEDFEAWTGRTGLPVLFMQVLFDEIYCMSFRRMLDAKARGHTYGPGDYVAESDRKTGKFTHRFFIDGAPHLCARATFPDESKGEVTVLPNGYVIPHIRYAPVGVSDVLPDVIETELVYPA